MTDRPQPAWCRPDPWGMPATALPAEITALLRLNSQTRVLRPLDPMGPADQLLARCYPPIDPAGWPTFTPAPDDTGPRGGDP